MLLIIILVAIPLFDGNFVVFHNIETGRWRSSRPTCFYLRKKL